MKPAFGPATPILPAANVEASLAWWTDICGFTEAFRHGEPASYAGVIRGNARFHLSLMTDSALARTVGDQTMLRIEVTPLEAFHAEYLANGGKPHPGGGAISTKPWGSREFATIDPNGICVTFFEAV